jgi:2-polyprenyl-3-methyl-5-hydroxy-6-metoxy-1,4-benzoquinol methylase
VVGDGYLLRRLYNSGLKVVGIDISEFLVNRLQSQLEEENLDIKMIRGDISTINLESDKFDLVFCLDVLEHIFYIKDASKKLRTF